LLQRKTIHFLGEKPSFLALGTQKMAKKAGFRPQTGRFNEFCGKNRDVLGRSTVFFVLLNCQKVAKRRDSGIKSGLFFCIVFEVRRSEAHATGMLRDLHRWRGEKSIHELRPGQNTGIFN
jgi:hypothetical protein